jgi:hypothetical protein
MKIEFPRITRPLKLADYAPEFGEQEILIWVNQPIAQRDTFLRIGLESARARQLIKNGGKDNMAQAVKDLDRLGGELMDWLAATWDFPRQEVEDLFKECLARGSGLYDWLVRETWDIVTNYRVMVKKN